MEPTDPPTDPETAPATRGSSLRTLLIGAGLVVAVLAAIGVYGATAGGGAPEATGLAAAPSELDRPTLADRPAPDQRMPLPDETLAAFGDGDEVDLTEFRGTPLVVNFWATWCVPCVEEMPEFQQVASETAGEVTFLGVNVQDAARNAEPFAADLGITYPLATDPQGEFWTRVGGFGMPTTLFVDAEGQIVYRQTGQIDAEQLREGLRTHLGAADPSL